MVGKSDGRADFDPGVAQRHEELFRVHDPGEGQHSPPLSTASACAFRLKPAAESGRPSPQGRNRLAAAPAPTMSRASARRSWLSSGARSGPAETPCRCRLPRRPFHHTRSSGPCAAPDSGSRRPSRSACPRARSVRARGPVACHDGGRERSAAQRLVADIGRSVLRRSTPTGRERAAVAAAQHNRPPSGPGQNLSDPQSPPASCRRRPRSGCRYRRWGCRRRVPAAPSAMQRPLRKRQPMATAGRRSGRRATRTTAHVLPA